MVGSDFSASCGGEAHAAVDEHAEERRGDDRASDGATVVEEDSSIECSGAYPGDQAGAVGGKGEAPSDLGCGSWARQLLLRLTLMDPHLAPHQYGRSGRFER
jgi:hypothetical protein